MEKLAKEINLKIKNSVLYSKYLESKNKVENDIYLIGLKDRLNNLKMVNCKAYDEELIKEYYDLEKEYYSNPIVKEYQKSKEDLGALLGDISDILSLK